MTYNPATRTLGGVPTESGAFTIGFRIADAAAHINVLTMSLRIGSVNTITSPYRLSDASQGVPYSLQLAATGTGPITWISGPPSGLPSGLTLSSSGLISGTPDTQGFINFSARAIDANGQIAVKTFGINVIAQLTITTVSLSDGLAANGSYGGCVNRSGGVGTVTFALSGQIPAGMVLQPNGCFDGSFPAQALREGGTFTFAVTATDSGDDASSGATPISIRVHADEQWLNTSNTTNVPLPSTRRVAQVLRTGTPFGLLGARCFTTSDSARLARKSLRAPIRSSAARRVRMNRLLRWLARS